MSPSFGVDGALLVAAGGVGRQPAAHLPSRNRTPQLYLSVDHGETWEPLPPLASGCWMDSFVFSPTFASDLTVLAVRDNSAIVMSINAGQTWADVSCNGGAWWASEDGACSTPPLRNAVATCAPHFYD